ncbi:MAG: hypothetical protein P8075_20810 [Deltaproteobacteria bacterium]
MAAAILTEDFLAICLILANGDLGTRLEEVICRARVYHERGVGNYEEMLTINPLLRHWINQILSYEDVYFNDEGEHWWVPEGAVPSEVNLKMRNFFSDTNNHDSQTVMRFLGGLGKDSSLLVNCSRPGCSS